MKVYDRKWNTEQLTSKTVGSFSIVLEGPGPWEIDDKIFIALGLDKYLEEDVKKKNIGGNNETD